MSGVNVIKIFAKNIWKIKLECLSLPIIFSQV